METQESRYFRIGSFVIIGLVLLVTGILILGSGKLFQKTAYIETYFNESVQGLSLGSPVKYRGLDIGHVKDITFVNEIYETKHFDKAYSRYIYVGMEITSSFLIKSTEEGKNQLLNKYIKDGLRIKLAQQGLTGNAYLELNFENPKKSPPLPIDWAPEHFYIPSATSTLTRFSDNVQYILDELKQVPFKKLFSSVDKLTQSSRQAVRKSNLLLNRLSQQLADTVNNLNNMSGNLRELSEQAKHFPSQILFGAPPPKLDPNTL
ncbi:MAG: MCE family protein [Gammaproteobacteria bacterium]|nr:MCE family protein [Gammaproteobacteria bacterium]